MSHDCPTFGSLFAGIGGIDLGLERAGWRGRWQVEYEPFCQRVLAKHWPDVTRYGDIKDVDWDTVERVDLIAGGFPCQPISIAGRQGAQDDVRWLWPEFGRAVGELRPRYVLVENVSNLLAVNDGSAFGEVLGDLATLGYDTEWDCVPAAAVGAPHLRDRLWLVGTKQRWSVADPDDGGSFDSVRAGRDAVGAGGTDVADPHSGQRAQQRPAGRVGRIVEPGEHRRPPGRGSAWEVEPDVGRVANGVPARVDRLRSLGNAVVPQVVEFIGRRILEAEGMR